MRAAFYLLRARVLVAHRPHRPPPTTQAVSPRAAIPRAQYPKNQQRRSAVTFMRGCNKRYRRCDMARGSLRPQKSHPSSHHELHGSLLRLLPSSRLNRCNSGYVAAAHLHKRTRDLHPSKVFSRPSVECSLAGAHSSSSQCEPAQAWEVDMCASKHHFAVGTCMPRLAV